MLICEGICKSFGGVRALVNVSIQFPNCGLTALIGPNGAGKTTLVNIITGFDQQDSGLVLLDGSNLAQCRPHVIARRGIVRTFQNLRLVRDLSVLDNVLLARPRQRGERLFYAVSRLGVAAEESGHSISAQDALRLVGLRALAERPAGELSYGQLKLLTLACCLATGANTMLLDEPVAGVHPQQIDSILQVLRIIRGQGKLVVFVEHNLQVVRALAEDVIVLSAGSIIAKGPPEEVLADRTVLEAYLT